VTDQGEKSPLSRRNFLWVGGVGLLAAFATACSPKIGENIRATEEARLRGSNTDLEGLDSTTSENLTAYTYQLREYFGEELISDATAFGLGAVVVDEHTVLEFYITNTHVINDNCNSLRIGDEAIFPTNYALFNASSIEDGQVRDLSVIVVKKNMTEDISGYKKFFWHSKISTYSPQKGDRVYFRGFQADRGFTAKGEVSSGLIKGGVEVKGEVTPCQGFEIRSGKIQGGGGSGSAVYKDGKVVASIFSSWQDGDLMYAVPVADALKRIFIGQGTSGQTIAQMYGLPEERFLPLFEE